MIPHDWQKIFDSQAGRGNTQRVAQSLAAGHRGEVMGAAAVILAEQKVKAEAAEPEG